MNKQSIGRGCLPFFVIVVILCFIRFLVAPGQAWEKGFTEFIVFLYWIGVGYMLLVIVVNKSNEPKKLSKEELLIRSIEHHKEYIEKYIDKNGRFNDSYNGANYEMISHHIVEIFNDKRELSYMKSKGISLKSYSYSKKSDHEYRRKMISNIIKENSGSSYAFSGGLYEGQAFDVYYGIGECTALGCHNKVEKDWHKFCYSCFRENNYQ